jgi:YD repeat-containing protein
MDGTTTAGYSYLANSPLVGQVGFTNGGSLRMTTVKSYDNLNRLLRINSTAYSTKVLASDYRYNAANQRTANHVQDGSYWVYDYDSLGQVISGKRYWSDGTPVLPREIARVIWACG